MVFTLASNATLYASLLFGGLFLWTSAPGWPAEEPPGMSLSLSALTAGMIAAGGVMGAAAVRRAGQGPRALLLASAAAHLAATLLLGWMALNGVPDRTGHALSAVCFAVLFYAGFHTALAAVFALYGAWRDATGLVSQRRNLDLRIGRLWHLYTAVTGVLGVAFIHLLIAMGSAGGAS